MNNNIPIFIMGIVFSIILARGGFKKNSKEKISFENEDDEPNQIDKNIEKKAE